MKNCIAILGIVCCFIVNGYAEMKPVGTATESSGSVDLTPCDLPAPINLNSTLLDEQTVKLSWESQGTITPSGFLIRTFDQSGDVVNSSTSSTNEIIISGLTENMNYVSHVYAICSDGMISDEYVATSFSMTIIIDLILNVVCDEPGTGEVAGNHLYAVPVPSNGASAEWLPFPANTNRIVYHAKVFKPDFEEIHYARFLIIRDLNSDTIHLKIYNPSGKMKVVLAQTKLQILFNNQLVGDLRFLLQGFTFNKSPSSTINYGAKVDFFTACEVSGPSSLMAEETILQVPLHQEEIGRMKMADMNIVPNPFSDQLDILLDLEELQNAQVSIYNAAGISVMDIPETRFDKGIHRINLNTTDFPSGIYYIVLKTDTFSKTMIIVK